MLCHLPVVAYAPVIGRAIPRSFARYSSHYLSETGPSDSMRTYTRRDWRVVYRCVAALPRRSPPLGVAT